VTGHQVNAHPTKGIIDIDRQKYLTDIDHAFERKPVVRLTSFGRSSFWEVAHSYCFSVELVVCGSVFVLKFKAPKVASNYPLI